MVKVEKNSAVVFLKNIVRSKWFYYCLVLVVVNILTAKWAVTKNDSSGMKFIVPVQLAVELGLAVAYYLVKKKKMPVEKVFLLLVIPFGLLFIALLPCGQTPDEAAHYMRTYGITKGELIVPQTETNNGGSLFIGINNSPAAKTSNNLDTVSAFSNLNKSLLVLSFSISNFSFVSDKTSSVLEANFSISLS